jgi:single-strand DNA-binding protein
MVNLNRVLLIGNLTKDPELRYTPSGTPVANLRLAVNSSDKSQSGEKKDEVCYVTIVVWSRQAEICNQYLKKGRSVFIEGRLIYRQWEQEGKTRSTMEVRADRVQFLGGPGGAGKDSAGDGTRMEEPEPEMAPEAGGGDADVPF